MLTFFVKSLYLMIISFLSMVKGKKNSYIFYLYSFPETSNYILDNLIETFPDRVVIVYNNSKKKEIAHFDKKRCLLICLNSFSFFKKNIPAQLKNSNLIFCDNYFPVLGGISFRKETNIVQLWHANGAIKKFGLEAEYVKKTLVLNKKRYQSVYNKFTHFVLSSNQMATIFSESFNIKFTPLFFGYPKTDVYFDKIFKEQIVVSSKKIKKNKKLLLYVPTYREETIFSLDIKKLLLDLGDEWMIHVHLHPHDEVMKEKISCYNDQQKFSDWSLSELLFITDCLLTDYSSVPFEYSLANPDGKIIYYCYDFNAYTKKVGVQDNFLEWAKDYIAFSQEEILPLIKSEKTTKFSLELNKVWNEYANGDSIKQLIEWIEFQDGN